MRNSFLQRENGICGQVNLANLFHDVDILEASEGMGPTGMLDWDGLLESCGYGALCLHYVGVSTDIERGICSVYYNDIFEGGLGVVLSGAEDPDVIMLPFLLQVLTGPGEEHLHAVHIFWYRGLWFLSDPVLEELVVGCSPSELVSRYRSLVMIVTVGIRDSSMYCTSLDATVLWDVSYKEGIDCIVNSF
jgi:hypothetical protein